MPRAVALAIDLKKATSIYNEISNTSKELEKRSKQIYQADTKFIVANADILPINIASRSGRYSTFFSSSFLD